MNEQQLAAVKQALERMETWQHVYPEAWDAVDEEVCTALKQAIAQPALPPMHASGLVAIKTLLSRDPCIHAKVAIEMIDAMLAADPQPVPVKTYHDGKPWPVAPKPWVGLTDEDKQYFEITGGKSDVLLAELVEARLRKKNAAAHPATEESSAAQRTPAPNMTHASDEWALTNQILRGDV